LKISIFEKTQAMKNFLLILFGALTLNTFAQQRSCHTMENHERLLMEDPHMFERQQKIEEFTNYAINSGKVDKNKAVITIPVVVHVVYNTTAQNVSDAQIQSQLDVLNKDFRKLNTDLNLIPSTFSSLVADAEINFCLANRDPSGNATTGILRVPTSVTSFSTNDGVKSSTTGGSNAWPASQYLNLWVCNMGGGILGYAQFPGGAASTDGVVIGYTCFGTTGTAQAPFNKGRTATHEVGHWLNLRHIWGDATCGSDLVTDTPVHNTSNYGCPTHPRSNSCGTSAEMFMNYMDYVDDACMQMFSNGQKARMQALFVSGGARASLATSPGCSGSTGGGTSTPSYCAASGTNTQFEWISNVKFNTINNTTTGSGGYVNYTTISTPVNKGSAYTITLTPSFASTAYTEYFKVYIDYNGDLDFVDAGELAYSSAGTTTAVNGSITIPTTAITGNVRMRVMMKDGAITGPCESFTYGEVEDYTLSVQNSSSGTTCSAPTGLSNSNIGTTTASVSWAVVSGATNYTVQYKKSTATSWTSVSTASTSISLTGLTSSTTYNWQVRTNCTSGSSTYSVGANFTTQAIISTSCTDTYETNNSFSAAKVISVNTNISATLGTSTDIDWFKFTNSTTAQNIRVTLSNLPADYDLRLYNSAGTLLSTSANGGTTVEQIKYNAAPIGTYYVRVYGYNGAFNASSCYTLRADISSTAFKQTEDSNDMENIEENQLVEVYPNPSNGSFTYFIDSQIFGEYSVTVTDSYGRIIHQEKGNKEDQIVKNSIELKNPTEGIYFVNVDNGSMKQLVKLLILK
jgi:hypothetical protein